MQQVEDLVVNEGGVWHHKWAGTCAALPIAGVRNFYMEGSEVAEIRVWCRGVLPS